MQVLIAILGTLSVFLLSRKGDRTKFWGFVTMLAAEPFWMIDAVADENWYIVWLSLICIGMAINGMRNHYGS